MAPADRGVVHSRLRGTATPSGTLSLQGFLDTDSDVLSSPVETLVHRDALARFGYALSDSTRSLILLSLRDGGRYPSDLADDMGVSRQIVSNHLACLRGCGLVVAVPEGRRSRYELADMRIAHALNDLVGLVLAVDPNCCPSSDDGCC
jgi:ArsR family transcriptional regulator, cadmium/lead-responsive transcriptional repressor